MQVVNKQNLKFKHNTVYISTAKKDTNLTKYVQDLYEENTKF